MKRNFGWLLLMIGLCTSAGASEPGCYRTVEAAAAQAGVRGVDGFRLDTVRRDVFSGYVWATVRSCAHPELPGVLVMAAQGRTLSVIRLAPEPAAKVLFAGTRVTLIETDDTVHMEMPGVTQAGGAVGDRVKVRLLPFNGETEKRFIEGIVRGAGVVEVAVR